METKFPISQNLHTEVDDFLTGYDIGLLKENLRRMLVDYLDYGLEAGVPLYFDNFFFPLNALLDVLELAAEEQTAYRLTEKAKKDYPFKPTPLEKVTQFLKSVLNPERIFLLHHFTAPGKTEEVDLLAVIPATSKTSFSYYEQVLTMASFEEITINVSLHKAEVINEQLLEGHIFYSMICTEQNMIYSNGAVTLPQTSNERLQQLAAAATQTFESAFNKANGFLHGASDYLGNSNNTLAAFMLQQAIEITLYGLITALLGHCPKTHYFRELKKPLKRCAPEIEYIISDNEEENRILLMLEKAYLESRYANNFSISNNDVSLLMEAAEALHEKVEEVFKSKINRLTS